jgi:hypothetical protein
MRFSLFISLMMTGLSFSAQDEWSATNKPKPESKVAPIAAARETPVSVGFA